MSPVVLVLAVGSSTTPQLLTWLDAAWSTVVEGLRAPDAAVVSLERDRTGELRATLVRAADKNTGRES